MVLKPINREKLETIFDKTAIEIFEFQLSKNVISQPERINGQEASGIQIPKEYLEQWCVQAIGAHPIGAGSYPIDILKDNWGADIKSLACKLNRHGKLANGDTGETSLAQKFKETGVNLDEMFNTGKYDEIKEGWLEIVKKKNELVIKEKGLEKIYYFFFLRGYKEYYLCGMEVFLDGLKDVTVDYNRSTKSSVFLKNYLESKYGYTKIYKAKKRLELRLKAKKWVEDGLCIELDIPEPLEPVNLREVDLEEYKKHLFG